MDYKEKYETALENLKRIKEANKDNQELVDFIEVHHRLQTTLRTHNK